MGQLEDRTVLPISNLPQMEAVLITTFVLPNTAETSSTASFSVGGSDVGLLQGFVPFRYTLAFNAWQCDKTGDTIIAGRSIY